MSNIKVMMVGASRSGKTSILASLHESRLNVREYGFTLRDIPKKERIGDNLFDSVRGMKALLDANDGNFTKMSSLKGTQDVEEYEFRMGYTTFPNIPDSTLTFIDVPGEYYNLVSNDYDEVCKLAKDCQILLVAVDTPAIMLAKERPAEQAWTDALICKDGVKDVVLNLGINCKANGNEPLRMLVFVPIKCERWLHDSEKKAENLNLIKEQVLKIYKEPIESMLKFGNSKVMMLPLETIGGLEFDYHTTPEKMKILVYDTNTEFEANDFGKKYEDKMSIGDDDAEKYISRCELDSDDADVVILARTGRAYQLKEGDRLMDVAKMPVYPFCYENSEHPIPYAWFKPVGEYKPSNCELLFYEIVKFLVQQVAADSGRNINELRHADDTALWQKVKRN